MKRTLLPLLVCDWSRPGVGQKKLKDTWLAFPKAGKAVRLGDGHGHDD